VLGDSQPEERIKSVNDLSCKTLRRTDREAGRGNNIKIWTLKTPHLGDQQGMCGTIEWEHGDGVLGGKRMGKKTLKAETAHKGGSKIIRLYSKIEKTSITGCKTHLGVRKKKRCDRRERKKV